jgi:carbon monoxide dehydrogenase subunit G
MHFEGAQPIKAPMQAVWNALLDPNRVAACTPGFVSMEILDANHFKPVVGVGLGAVKAKFTLDVQVTERQEPDRAAMKMHGVAAGSAVDMVATVNLAAASEAETTMNWVADVTVSGTIASVGARLIESVARKQVAKFFDCFSHKLEEPEPEAASEEAPSPPNPLP